MLADGLGRVRQRLLCFGTQIRLVVIEINVGYVLIEKLLLRERRWWWRRRWWRLRYRDGCCGLLSSAFARRGQAIGSGLRRRNALGSAGVNLGAVQRYIV